MKINPRTIVQELQTLVASWGHKVSKSTIRLLPPYQQALWKGCRKKALTESNQQIQASGVCQTWNYDWNRVLWKDETKIELFGHQKMVAMYTACLTWQTRDAYKKNHLIPTIKYSGGSLMLWCCFTASGPGALVKINGMMTFHQVLGQFSQKPGCLCQEAETWP